MNILNTFYHNYKLRKHTINTQITCCNGASGSMENQNLETKKNLYVRQRFQLLSLELKLSTQSVYFQQIQGVPFPGSLNADNKELSVLGICQKCFSYTSGGRKIRQANRITNFNQKSFKNSFRIISFWYWMTQDALPPSHTPQSFLFILFILGGGVALSSCLSLPESLG